MSKLTANRFALVISGTLIMALFWTYFLFLPYRMKTTAAMAELNSMEQDVSTARQFLEQASTIGERKDSLDERRSRMLSAVYSSDSLDAFIDRVTSIIEAFDITQVDVSPDLNGLLTAKHIDLWKSKLIVVSFTVHGQGRYVHMGRALEVLQRQPFCAGLERVELNYNESTNPDLLCNFKFAAYLRDEGKSND